MSRSITALVIPLALLATISVCDAQKRPKSAKSSAAQAKPAGPVKPRQESQFVTVDEFVLAKRAKGTAVSVEGYAVVGLKQGSGIKLSIVDSVDHVLNASDANSFAARGASAVLSAPPAAKRAAWSMGANGLGRFVMYTGVGSAQRELHDIVAKLRITGRASGRSINVTAVEFMDDNGDWKKL